MAQEILKPMMLDETGQAIVTALNSLTEQLTALNVIVEQLTGIKEELNKQNNKTTS